MGERLPHENCHSPARDYTEHEHHQNFDNQPDTQLSLTTTKCGPNRKFSLLRSHGTLEYSNDTKKRHAPCQTRRHAEEPSSVAERAPLIID